MLRRRYSEYRKRQAQGLLALVPRESIRPLLQEARRRGAEGVMGADAEAGDSMELLLRFCEEILPLPPFEIWRGDFQANRSTHLEAELPAARGPQADGPVTVAFRSFTALGATWYAALDVRPGRTGWTGHLTYHTDSDPTRFLRTADVFREADAEAVRRRFLEFDDSTLQAFLRSVLP